MKILALNPPFLPRYSRESRSPAVSKSGTLYYPMWLAYAAGWLEKSGHEIALIDAAAVDMKIEEVIERARAFGPAMAILDTSTPSIYHDAQVAARLTEAVPGLFVVLVGVHVSALPVETLRESPGVHAVAFSEYEATLAELASVLAGGDSDERLRAVAGLAFRAADGTCIKNRERPHIQNLDELPFVSSVYRRHLDIRPYFYGHSRYPLVVIVTGRGCPFRCTYCVVPQVLQGHAYRKRTVANVVEEFRYIAANFSEVKEIMIEDDTLTADTGRCRELALALIDARATTIPWSANARPEVDLETMRVMRKAGCRLFCVGLESGDQRILDNIRKGTRIERIHQFMRDARRAGILVHGCFMVGNRGETRQTLETTLRFAKELNPDTAQFYPIMIYPGTEDYRWFDERGWITTRDFRQWLTRDGLHSSVMSNPDLTYECLVAFCDRARREFYLRLSYIMRKGMQAVLRPSEFPRLLKGFRRVFRYLVFPSRIGERQAA